MAAVLLQQRERQKLRRKNRKSPKNLLVLAWSWVTMPSIALSVMRKTNQTTSFVASVVPRVRLPQRARKKMRWFVATARLRTNQATSFVVSVVLRVQLLLLLLLRRNLR